MLQVIQAVKRFWMKEQGSVDQMVWVIGAAVVVVLIIVAAMVFMPSTAQTIWTQLVTYITNSFKF